MSGISYPAPSNPFTPIFNVNDFTSSGNETVNSETVLGDETVLGNLILNSEPTLLNINTTSLNNNNLVSKLYVDNTISTSIATNNNISDAYPTEFFFGNSATTNLLAPSIYSGYVQINSGYVQISGVNNTLIIRNYLIELSYQITESYPNSSSVYKHFIFNGVYELTYYKNNNTFIGSSYTNIRGNSLTGALGVFNNTIPIQFGIYQNLPTITFNFPTYRNPNNYNSNWISSYGVSMKIMNSSPLDQENEIYGNSKQNGYFVVRPN